MDRLTFEGDFCTIAMCQGEYRMTSECADGPCSQRKVWERLKAYEDTGLEPEEIEKMRGEMVTCYDESGFPYSVDADGNEAKHIIDLLEAESQGRLVVLPCKVGDTAYRVIRRKDGGGHIAPATVSGLHLGDTTRNRRYKKGNEYIVLRVDDMYCSHVDVKEIGKTVFLTRGEAKAALKGCDEK